MKGVPSLWLFRHVSPTEPSGAVRNESQVLVSPLFVMWEPDSENSRFSEPI